MIQLKLLSREKLDTLIYHRAGEKKLGDAISLLANLDDLKNTAGTYVIFGICESIGVQANYGKPGAQKAWSAFLRTFINIQSTVEDNDIILLGSIKVTPAEDISSKTSRATLGAIVERIDHKVADLVQRIIEAGKFPIIIGGGHNNAFGNLKGSSRAIGKSMNALNIDAHTDLRTTDYRHSGNGFSYAFENKQNTYLNKYIVFGLHQNYTPEYIFDYMKSHKKRIHYYMMEDMLSHDSQVRHFENALTMMYNEHWGLELDCDSIMNFPSSARTASGFSLETIRRFMQLLGEVNSSMYLHICEAAPEKKDKIMVGKALTYLVTDFIRSHRANSSI